VFRLHFHERRGEWAPLPTIILSYDYERECLPRRPRLNIGDRNRSGRITKRSSPGTYNLGNSGDENVYGVATAERLETEYGSIGIAPEHELGMDWGRRGDPESRVRNEHVGEDCTLDCEGIGALRDENPILVGYRGGWQCGCAVDWGEFWCLWVPWIHDPLKITGVDYTDSISCGRC